MSIALAATTLDRMPLDPTLLVRRWPERRPVVLVAAAVGFAALVSVGDPALAALYVVPVALAALELGLVGGGVIGGLGGVVALASGGFVPAATAVAVGLIAGRFSDRMRAVHTREQRLVASGLALGQLSAYQRLPQALAAAAAGMPRVVGVEVQLDGLPTLQVGRMTGSRTGTVIVARGAELGRVTVAHRGSLEREDRAALELLAAQAALAADSHRLLAEEREAAAVEADLRRARDDLLEQRAGLGQLLAAQEHDRHRTADTLHEELAQALAAVLLGLRMLRRRQSLDESAVDDLYAQVVGVLEELRELAGALRPSSLTELGLIAAVEALADVRGPLHVDARGVQDPLPEPLRTGLYRLIEGVLLAGRPGAPASVRLRADDGQLDAVVDVELSGAEDALGAARARAALLQGSLDVARQPDGRTRLRARLPLQAEARDRGTRTAARTPVPASWPAARRIKVPPSPASWR